MKRIALLAAWACTAFAAPADVLIVYDPGPVYNTVAAGADDTLTSGATRATVNTKKIAEALRAGLEARQLTVRVVPVSKLRKHEDLLEPRLIVLGTPTRFSNMSWETKKLFDEQFFQLLKRKPAELAKRKVAAFALGEVEPAATAALDTVRKAVEDCGGKLEGTLAMVTSASRADLERDARQFASEILPR